MCSNYLCHLHSFLYQGQWNGFFTFLDNAVDWQKLVIKRNTVSQGLNRIVYLIIQNATEGQLQSYRLMIIMFFRLWL